MAVGDDTNSEPSVLSWTNEIRFLIGLFCIASLLIPLTTFLEENYSNVKDFDLNLPHFSLLLAYLVFLSTAILFLFQLRYMNRQRQKTTTLGGYLFLLGLVGLSNSVFLDAFSVDNSWILFLDGFFDELGFFLLAAIGGFGEVSRLDELLVSWVNRNKLLIIQLLLVGLAVIVFLLVRDLWISLGILMIAFMPTPIRRRQQIFDKIQNGYNWVYNRRVQVAIALLNLFAILMLGATIIAFLYEVEAAYLIVLLSLSLFSAFIANHSLIISKTKNALQYLNENRLGVYRTVCTSIGGVLLLLPFFADSLVSVWPYILLVSFFFLLFGWLDRVVAKLKQVWIAVVDTIRALILGLQNTVKRIQKGLERGWGYCQAHWQGIARALGTIAALGLALVGLFFYRLGPLVFGFSILFWLSLVLLLLLYLAPLLVLAGWLGHKITQAMERAIQAIHEFTAYISANRLKTYRIACTATAVAVVLILLLVGPLRSLWVVLFFGGLILILVAAISDALEDIRNQLFLIGLPAYLLGWFGLALIAPLLDDFSDIWAVIFAFALLILLLGFLDRIAEKARAFGVAFAQTTKKALIFVSNNRMQILRTIGNVFACFFLLLFIFSFLSGSINYLLGIAALFLLSASNPQKTKQYSQNFIGVSRKTGHFLYRKRYRVAWLVGSSIGIVVCVFGILAEDIGYLLIGIALFSLTNAYYVPRVARMLWNQLQIASQWVWANKKGILRTITTTIAVILGIGWLIDGNIIFLLAAVLLLYAAFFGPINTRLGKIFQQLQAVIVTGLKALQYAFYRFVQVLPLFLLLFISLGLLGLGLVSIIGWDFTGVFADSPPMVLVLVGIGYLLAGGFTGHFAIERRARLRWKVLPIPASPKKEQSKKKSNLLDKGLAEVKPLLDKGLAEVKPFLDKGLATYKKMLGDKQGDE